MRTYNIFEKELEEIKLKSRPFPIKSFNYFHPYTFFKQIKKVLHYTSIDF